jgi:hypothetical protein
LTEQPSPRVDPSDSALKVLAAFSIAGSEMSLHAESAVRSSGPLSRGLRPQNNGARLSREEFVDP